MLGLFTRRSTQLSQTSFRSNHLLSPPLLRYASSNAPSRYEPVGKALKLPSGRTLGYHTSGDPNGIPVMYMHGNPDSGIQVTGDLETKLAKKLGIRWIGPDRPGVGLSTMYDEQQISHYPQDVKCLADHLSLNQFYMIGTSGGTGFTLACAKDLSDQLKGVGICAGVGPIECGFDSMGEVIKKGWDAWEEIPAELEAYLESEYVSLAQEPDPSALRARIESDLKWLPGDNMLPEDMLTTAVEGYRQVYAQGARAHAKGIELNLRPWGFRVEDVKFPGIKLWYGKEDVNTTPTMGKYMADRLPKSVYKEYKENHYKIWNEENLEDMLRDLLSAKK